MSKPETGFTFKRIEGGLRILSSGPIVASTVESQRNALKKAMEKAGKAVVLDLGGTEQIDSLGITLVVGLFTTCKNLKIPFSVEGASGDILRVFKLCSLTKVFPVKSA